jgi:N-acetylmuramoyl-L-alanine amidase
MKWQQFLLSLCLAAGAARSWASPPPGSVRIRLNEQSREVRVFGDPATGEFYAPIVKPLRSLWLDVRTSDAGPAEVRYQGEVVARWPVVTRVERLPEGSGSPTVLREGNTLLVPVRATVALGHGWVEWDARARSVTITPTVRRLALREGGRGLEVQLEASAPVRVTSTPLSDPPRIALDITPARFHLTDAPQAGGRLRSLRLEQPARETARVVLELAGGPAQVAGLPRTATIITARVEPGESVWVTRRPEPQGEHRVPQPRSPSADPPDSADAPAEEAAPPPHASAAVPPENQRPEPFRRPNAEDRTPNPASIPPENPRPGPGGAKGALPRRVGGRRRGTDNPLAGRVIAIDPGHGGPDRGVLAPDGVREGDVCLAIGRQAARSLRDAGATVLLTREEDRYVSLEDRCALARQPGVDLFLSIHCNVARRSGETSGTETCFSTPQSKDLARALHPAVVRASGGRDRGIRQRRYAVLRRPGVPAVLLEVGYLDHARDAARLEDSDRQEALGVAVREGLERYFRRHPAPSSFAQTRPY